MQIPLIGGRDFTDRDTPTSPRVAIVSETFVRRFLGGKSPIGKVIRTAPEPKYPAAEYEIIGMVKDTKYLGLREEEPPPEAYAPASQYPDAGRGISVLVRSSVPLSAVISALRAKFGEINPDIGMDVSVLEKEIQNSLIRERTMALLSGFFGALAALLAMIGLYGVISYIALMRRNEIGIRMALGASRRSVVGIIVRQTLVLLAMGVGVGVLFALAGTRGAASLLFRLQPNDPLTFVAAAALLVTVALFASFLPALRASRLDPMSALRYE
jgi:predicted permease